MPSLVGSEMCIRDRFYVAEAFTGREGKYVKLEDSMKGFKKIIAGELDHIPERAFYMTGTIEEVLENAEQLKV